MDRLIEALTESEQARVFKGYAIAPGVVKSNLDFLAEGRVQVRIPSLPDFEPWARVSAVGAGAGRGFFWIPQIDDEVLVAFAQNDLSSAYILGGLWNSQDRPPVSTPDEALTKRVMKTGISSAPGHEIEFDDLLQSVTITTSTKQKIALTPTKIEIANTAGTLTISLDNASQTISISSAVKLELKGTLVSIEGQSIDIKGTKINVQAAGPCTVAGLPIKLN